MTRVMLAGKFGPPDVLTASDVKVAAPEQGEVTIDVRASGVNPSDYMNISGQINDDPSRLPVAPGYEIAGVISAIGPDTEIASGLATVGDSVVAFCISGGYATRVTVLADDVFHMPSTLSFPEAANLLLSGTTAARMLAAAGLSQGDTIIVHGASGATGVSVLQQAGLLGVRVVGTCSESNFDLLRRFGATPVQYGPGLEERIREVAPERVAAALDCVGTDEAIDVSLSLVQDRKRIITIAAFPRAFGEDIVYFIGSGRGTPNDAFRAHVIDLAQTGKLVVPVSRTFPLESAAEALNTLLQRHPGGKFALVG